MNASDYTDWQTLKDSTLFLMVCWEYTAPLYFVVAQDDERIEGVQLALGREGICIGATFRMAHDYVQEYFVPRKRAYLTMNIGAAVSEMVERRRVHQGRSHYPASRYMVGV